MTNSNIPTLGPGLVTEKVPPVTVVTGLDRECKPPLGSPVAEKVKVLPIVVVPGVLGLNTRFVTFTVKVSVRILPEGEV